MNGVKVSFLNRKKILTTLKGRAKRILKENPDVIEISLFGSLVKGNYTPNSDADLLIILRHSELKLTKRIEFFGRYFDRIGINVEVFPYTAKELEAMKERGFIKSVMKERVVVAAMKETERDSARMQSAD